MARIMVVDDEKYICESLSRALTKEGYEVKSSCDGAEALGQIEEYKPNIVILDFKMPGMDGLEVCRRIKSNENIKNIPVIIITAYLQEKEAALEVGADDFLSKPIDNLDILIRVRYILKINELTEELQQLKAYLEGLKRTPKEW